MKWLLLTLLSGCCIAAIGMAANRAARAHTTMRQSLHDLQQTSADAEDLSRLRGHSSTIAESKRPEPGLVGQVSDVLTETGLPISTMTSLSPEADSAVTSGTARAQFFRRQSARLVLEPITLQELGKFLGVWRSRLPEWTASSIQITPMGTQVDGADRRLRVNIVIEAIYLEQVEKNPPS